MKATDLRIGNLVLRKDLFDNKQKFKETIVCHNAITACYPNNDNFQPIPLTEEWLLKFGFVREKNIIKIYTKDKISIYWDCNEYPKGRIYFNSWCILKEKIQYVHTLQNLIHALTNEELTYDPN